MNKEIYQHRIDHPRVDIVQGMTVNTLHAYLGGLIANGHGHCQVTLGEPDGTTIGIGAVEPRVSDGEVVIT